MKIFLMLPVLLVLVSCSPKERRPESGGNSDSPDAIKKKAQDYLRPLLHIGESSTNLIERFGNPTSEDQISSNEVCLSFFFLDQNHTLLAAGVGGFEAFVISNRVTRWLPIYEIRNPKYNGNQ